MRKTLQISFLSLLILLFILVVFYNKAPLPEYQWLRDLSLNLGTEILGIYLTVFLIDAVIRNNEEKERLRVRNIALQQLNVPLRHQLIVLQSMYKASVANVPEQKPSEVRDLFSDTYFEQIEYLDLLKPAPLASAIPLDWIDYLRMGSHKFKDSLGRTLEKYTVFLDGDTVEIIESMINSSLLSLFEQLIALRDLDRELWSNNVAPKIGGSRISS